MLRWSKNIYYCVLPYSFGRHRVNIFVQYVFIINTKIIRTCKHSLLVRKTRKYKWSLICVFSYELPPVRRWTSYLFSLNYTKYHVRKMTNKVITRVLRISFCLQFARIHTPIDRNIFAHYYLSFNESYKCLNSVYSVIFH